MRYSEVVVAGRRSAFVLHSEAVAFNDDDLAMMNNPVEDSACYDIVIVENNGPLFERPVGCEESGTALVSSGYNLEKEIGSLLVDGDVTEFVDAQKAGCGVFSERGIKGSCGVGCRKVVDDIHGSGEFYIETAATCVMG